MVLDRHRKNDTQFLMKLPLQPVDLYFTKNESEVTEGSTEVFFSAFCLTKNERETMMGGDGLTYFPYGAARNESSN